MDNKIQESVIDELDQDKLMGARAYYKALSPNDQAEFWGLDGDSERLNTESQDMAVAMDGIIITIRQADGEVVTSQKTDILEILDKIKQCFEDAQDAYEDAQELIQALCSDDDEEITVTNDGTG